MQVYCLKHNFLDLAEVHRLSSICVICLLFNRSVDLIWHQAWHLLELVKEAFSKEFVSFFLFLMLRDLMSIVSSYFSRGHRAGTYVFAVKSSDSKSSLHGIMRKISPS